jgi:hypothetical protein
MNLNPQVVLKIKDDDQMRTVVLNLVAADAEARALRNAIEISQPGPERDALEEELEQAERDRVEAIVDVAETFHTLLRGDD